MEINHVLFWTSGMLSDTSGINLRVKFGDQKLELTHLSVSVAPTIFPLCSFSSCQLQKQVVLHRQYWGLLQSNLLFGGGHSTKHNLNILLSVHTLFVGHDSVQVIIGYLFAALALNPRIVRGGSDARKLGVRRGCAVKVSRDSSTQTFVPVPSLRNACTWC